MRGSLERRRSRARELRGSLGRRLLRSAPGRLGEKKLAGARGANEPGQIWLPVDVRPQVSRFRKHGFFLGRRGAAWSRLICSPSSIGPKTASKARSEVANRTMQTASPARPDSFHAPRGMSITLGLSCSIGAACGLPCPARSSRCAVVSSHASSMRPRSASV